VALTGHLQVANKCRVALAALSAASSGPIPKAPGSAGGYLHFKNDDAAIAKAKALAIGVSIDKPEVDPKRHIAVLNESREELFKVPVYSKPSMSTT
jgi:hypothetical protein